MSAAAGSSASAEPSSAASALSGGVGAVTLALRFGRASIAFCATDLRPADPPWGAAVVSNRSAETLFEAVAVGCSSSAVFAAWAPPTRCRTPGGAAGFLNADDGGGGAGGGPLAADGAAAFAGGRRRPAGPLVSVMCFAPGANSARGAALPQPGGEASLGAIASGRVRCPLQGARWRRDGRRRTSTRPRPA